MPREVNHAKFIHVGVADSNAGLKQEEQSNGKSVGRGLQAANIVLRIREGKTSWAARRRWL